MTEAAKKEDGHLHEVGSGEPNINMILDILVSLEEAKAGMLKEYKFE